MSEPISVYDLEIDYIGSITDESLVIQALAVAREAASEGRGHGQYAHDWVWTRIYDWADYQKRLWIAT